MTRKLTWVGLSYALGLLVCAYAPQPVFAGLLLCGTALLAVCLLRKKQAARAAIVLVSFAVGGLLCTGWQTYRDTPAKRFSGQTATFSGTILSVDSRAGDKAVYRLNGEIDGVPLRVSCTAADLGGCYGDKISLTAVWQAPENTFLFPAKTYYRGEGVSLLCMDAEEIAVTPTDGGSWTRLVRGVNAVCADCTALIQRTLPPNEAGLLTAMLFGEKTGLTDTERAALYRAGIGHITAVSGLHLTLVCACVAALLRRLRIGKRATAAAMLGVIVLFALCAGLSDSVLRAGVMMALVYAGPVAARRTDALNSLCCAFVGLTAFAPYLVCSAAFLLSCAAAFAVSVLAPWLTEKMAADTFPRRVWRNAVRMACVTVAVLPVSVLYFDETSVIAPIANLILVPLCTAALLCGLVVLAAALLTGGVGLPMVLSVPLVRFGGLLCRVVLRLTAWCGAIPLTHLPVGTRVMRILPAVLGIAVLLAFAITRKRRVTGMALGLSVLVFLNAALLVPLLQRGRLYAAVLGRGDACTLVLVHGGSADILDFSGGRHGADAAGRYLSQCGISYVDTLYLGYHPLSAAPCYEAALDGISPETVLVPAGTPLVPGMTVCGNTPETMEDAAFSRGMLEAAVTAQTAEIRYAGRTLVCRTGNDPAPDCDMLVLYGDDAPAEVTCGYLLITGDARATPDARTIVGENNVAFTVTPSGGISWQRLEK